MFFYLGIIRLILMATDTSLEQLLKYIIENDIEIYETNKCNKYTLIIRKHIDKLPEFLDKYESYKNNTWIYIKGIYLYLMGRYDEMIILLNNIDEPNILMLLGDYYEDQGVNHIHLNIKCYERAIELKNPEAMYNLGLYYYFNLDCKNMKKYLEMASDLNHIDAINCLARYYKGQEYNYERDDSKVIKYYKMGIDLNSIHSMVGLADFYCNTKHGTLEEIEKYYTMALKINNKCEDAICGLANYYYKYGKKINQMIECYIMGIELGCVKPERCLKKYCRESENNESKYYEYVYYPRILAIIICMQRKILKQRHAENKREIKDVPVELYYIIFNDYITQ